MAEKKSKNEESNDEESKDDRSTDEETSTTVWEWVIAAVGLLLVAGAVGSMFYRAATEEQTPPQLEVVAETIEPNGRGFLVRFSVKNTGSETAAAVAVEGELKKGSEVAETSTSTLTYSPAHSTRRGGLYFTKNPHEYELQIRATGYEEP